MSPKIKALRDDIIRPSECKMFLIHAKKPIKRALIAFLYAYGKRISEILNLKRQDIYLNDANIEVKFLLLKRKPRSGILPIRKLKLSRAHYLAPIIENWISPIKDPEAWIFPGNSGGHIHRITAWRWLKAISQDIWPHLFRHSLATLMAENGATAFELVAWFHWANMDTARTYVKDTDAMADRFAKRDF